MKNLLKVFVFVFLTFFAFSFNVKAIDYTQDEVKQRVIDTEPKAREVVDVLTSWSNTYGGNAENLINRDFIRKINSLNYVQLFDLVVSELNSKGYSAAASALQAKRNIIISDLDYLKETLDMVEDYLNKNVSGGVVGSRKLFNQIEDSMNNLKSPIKNLIDIYYNKFESQVLADVDSFNSVSDLRNAYNEILDKYTELDSEVSSLKNRFSNWQDLYNKYNMSDYEDYIKEEFGDYYRKLDSLYNKVYSRLESKFQTLLDNKIQTIITETHTETDYSNPDNVLERNNRLWDIINYIEDLKTEIQDKYDEVNSYVKIQSARNYLNKYETQILDRVIEAIEYTKTYLIDNLVISVKNEADKSFIKIDTQRGLIIYDSKALEAATFIAKLKASYGTLKPVKLYNGNVGTLSEVQAVYNNEIIKDLLVVVKGDVNPSGRIDITDIVNVCNKMFGKISLSTYQFIAADMNNDSKIDITDIVMICNRMFK